MNDYEMMEQRVDQLRLKLAQMHKWEEQNKRLKEDIMAELLDTRRQITRADKLKVKMGYFTETRSNTFKEDAMVQMLRLTYCISDVEWKDDPSFQAVTWKGIRKDLAPCDTDMDH